MTVNSSCAQVRRTTNDSSLSPTSRVRRLASKKKTVNFHIFTYILQPHLMARVKTTSANTHRLYFLSPQRGYLITRVLRDSEPTGGGGTQKKGRRAEHAQEQKADERKAKKKPPGTPLRSESAAPENRIAQGIKRGNPAGRDEQRSQAPPPKRSISTIAFFSFPFPFLFFFRTFGSAPVVSMCPMPMWCGAFDFLAYHIRHFAERTQS